MLLSKQKQDEFFEIYGKDFNITDKKITKMFSRDYKTKKTLFSVSDEITIGPEVSKFVSPNSVTTIGSLLFNKLCIEHLEIFGYINRPINGDVVSDIDSKLAVAFMNDKITHDQYAKYIDNTQYLFGGVLSSVINSSISEEILQLPPRAKKLLDTLIKENIDKLEPVTDPLVAQMIEKEVCAVAKEEIRKSNPSAMDIFDSKCGISFENNYKTMFVMKGAIQDNTGEYANGYKIITSNYNTGVTKEDYHKFADSLVTSAYSKGKTVATGGYITKKMNAMSQNVRLGPNGSDCGTKNYLPVLIPEKGDLYLYRYIVENGKLVYLEDSNINKYRGKIVMMRSPMYCHNEHYCSKCYGERKYILGIKNVGLAFNTASNSLLNANMKKFHDITIKVYKLDIDKDILNFV